MIIQLSNFKIQIVLTGILCLTCFIGGYVAGSKSETESVAVVRTEYKDADSAGVMAPVMKEDKISLAEARKRFGKTFIDTTYRVVTVPKDSLIIHDSTRITKDSLTYFESQPKTIELSKYSDQDTLWLRLTLKQRFYPELMAFEDSIVLDSAYSSRKVHPVIIKQACLKQVSLKDKITWAFVGAGMLAILVVVL